MLYVQVYIKNINIYILFTYAYISYIYVCIIHMPCKHISIVDVCIKYTHPRGHTHRDIHTSHFLLQVEGLGEH